MYYLSDYYKKLYDIEHFNEKDNYYFIILDRNKLKNLEYIYQQIKTDQYNITDMNNQEVSNIDPNILHVDENIEEISIAPIKIIYGHFYNDFNDIIYHPVDKHTKEIMDIYVGREFYDNILRFYGHIYCMNKSVDVIMTYVDLFRRFPELYLDIDDNMVNKIIYTDNTGNLVYGDIWQNTLDSDYVNGNSFILNNH